ncbi:hypothetical protein EHW99_1067 [Erwinia amylovora]|uniref:Uncharacterized protein n=2 Tax=Erwinia amylovora TaxID=552 RepID=A0A831A003_ERWAM|nr:hypothetical protein EaACW_2548 [Erwinia amylovora ACW56400]QJQ53774.1 hypothetical protein EHX00_1067 [Erwinia amylovora]CBA21901.1 hypothetical protein predicted by Glimmer/Critica [Erwinia amylovora CFBP1430]CCO79392.1 hypothetical protein BN432_2613 [Erwinia amylovora Ea356]CCO83194.1 hypothetical protein BN433_2635 [Erwinia amylovora Ea266]CCO86958.1 hypothetical protein BN434_2587 [Erwinia amylovora CFBP 2585]CCO90753.1 hypothetical protein BN435_2601 [Erwinia amylovora 01SFR-BO]CCO
MPLSLPDNNDNAYSDVHNLQDRRDKSWRYHLAAPVAQALLAAQALALPSRRVSMRS